MAVLELLSSNAPAHDYDAVMRQATPGDDAELAVLEHAKQLGLRISAELDRYRQREAGFSSLVDTARELTTAGDLDALLRVITRKARLLLGVDMSYISFPDDAEPAGSVYIRTADGQTSILSVGLRLPSNAGLGNKVMTSPSPFWTPDYLQDDRIRHNKIIDDVVRAEGLHAIMAVPLGAKPFGALYAASRAVRHFTSDEVALASSLGELAGVAIERALLQERTDAVLAELKVRNTGAELAVRSMRELSRTRNLLLELVLSDGDLHALAEKAQERLGGAVRLCSANGTLLAAAGQVIENDEAFMAAAMIAAHAANEPVLLDNGTWAASICAGGEDLGTLLVQPDRPVTEHDRDLIQVTAQVAAVQQLLENRTAIAEGQARDDLLDDLLADPQRPPQQLTNRAHRQNIDLYQPHVVLVVRPEGDAKGKIAVWASAYSHRRNGLKTMSRGCTVLLLPGTDAAATARAAFDNLSGLLRDPVTVSASSPVSDPGSVFHGYHEALRCLEAMTALGATGRPATARELGFVGILLADNHDVDGFVHAAIGPILDYDRLRSTELARTLEVYFAAGSSPTYAAKELHVHPNTVARRLERISELLGAQWQEPTQTLEVQLALRLCRVRNQLVPGAAPVDTGAAPDQEA
jgi:GAF domain-containing protein/sugar diacid utilization regulator